MMTLSNKDKRMWKEAVMAYFNEPIQSLPTGTEENYENPQSGLPVSR
jgi:hypothetical protein